MISCHLLLGWALPREKLGFFPDVCTALKWLAQCTHTERQIFPVSLEICQGSARSLSLGHAVCSYLLKCRSRSIAVIIKGLAIQPLALRSSCGYERRFFTPGIETFSICLLFQSAGQLFCNPANQRWPFLQVPMMVTWWCSEAPAETRILSSVPWMSQVCWELSQRASPSKAGPGQVGPCGWGGCQRQNLKSTLTHQHRLVPGSLQCWDVHGGHLHQTSFRISWRGGRCWQVRACRWAEFGSPPAGAEKGQEIL